MSWRRAVRATYATAQGRSHSTRILEIEASQPLLLLASDIVMQSDFPMLDEPQTTAKKETHVVVVPINKY